MRSTPPVGPALLRIGLPLIMLSHLLPDLAYSSLLFPKNGTLLVLLAIASSVVCIFGIMPRLAVLLFALCAAAVVYANQEIVDAGQHVVVLVSFLLCLTDTSRWALLPIHVLSRLSTSVSALLQQTGSFLITWQLCAIYAWSAFYKFCGPDWRDGTAVYYTVRLEDYIMISPLSHFIAAHLAIATGLTYAALAVQALFPILVWFRRTKLIIILPAIVMHLGIALVLGLWSFSLTMILLELAVLGDAVFTDGRYKIRALSFWRDPIIPTSQQLKEIG